MSCFRQIGEGPASSLLLLLSCLRFKTSLSQGAGSEAAAVLPYGKSLWGQSSERPAAQRRRAPTWPFPRLATPRCCRHSLALLLPQPPPQEPPIPRFPRGVLSRTSGEYGDAESCLGVGSPHLHTKPTSDIRARVRVPAGGDPWNHSSTENHLDRFLCLAVRNKAVRKADVQDLV